jgi:hypothetical protein
MSKMLEKIKRFFKRIMKGPKSHDNNSSIFEKRPTRRRYEQLAGEDPSATAEAASGSGTQHPSRLNAMDGGSRPTGPPYTQAPRKRAPTWDNGPLHKDLDDDQWAHYKRRDSESQMNPEPAVEERPALKKYDTHDCRMNHSGCSSCLACGYPRCKHGFGKGCESVTWRPLTPEPMFENFTRQRSILRPE